MGYCSLSAHNALLWCSQHNVAETNILDWPGNAVSSQHMDKGAPCVAQARTQPLFSKAELPRDLNAVVPGGYGAGPILCILHGRALKIEPSRSSRPDSSHFPAGPFLYMILAFHRYDAKRLAVLNPCPLQDCLAAKGPGAEVTNTPYYRFTSITVGA